MDKGEHDVLVISVPGLVYFEGDQVVVLLEQGGSLFAYMQDGVLVDMEDLVPYILFERQELLDDTGGKAEDFPPEIRAGHTIVQDDVGQAEEDIIRIYGVCIRIHIQLQFTLRADQDQDGVQFDRIIVGDLFQVVKDGNIAIHVIHLDLFRYIVEVYLVVDLFFLFHICMLFGCKDKDSSGVVRFYMSLRVFYCSSMNSEQVK